MMIPTSLTVASSSVSIMLDQQRADVVQASASTERLLQKFNAPPSANITPPKSSTVGSK